MINETIGSHFLIIQGFRGARIDDSKKVLRNLREAFHGADLQLVRADMVAGKEHIIFAARNAVASFAGKGRRSKHLSMELLLYASGQHQIVEAIKYLGVTTSTQDLVLVWLSETMPDPKELSVRVAQMINGTPDDSVLELETRQKVTGLRTAYRISGKEMKSSMIPGELENNVVKRLVIERSALLSLEN
jgi:KEOPS complex subunit Cgi121